MQLWPICLVIPTSFLLGACEDPKTVEGSIYINSSLGTPIRMQGAEVRLIKPQFQTKLLQHLKNYEQRITAATASLVKKELDAYLDYQKEGVTYNQDLRAKTVSRLEQEKMRLSVVIEDGNVKKTEIKKRLNQLTTEKATLSGKLQNLEKIFNDGKFALSLKQKEKDLAYAEKRNKLSKNLTRAKIEVETRLANKKKSLERLSTAQRKQISSLKFQIRSAESRRNRKKQLLDQKRQRTAKNFAKSYAKNKIAVIKSRNKYIGRYKCFQFRNDGNKAVTRIELDILYRGKSLLKAGMSRKMLYSLIPTYDILSPKTKNKYKEEVQGVARGFWPEKPRCMYISKNSIVGDVARVFEKIGGFVKGSDFTLVVTNAKLSDFSSIYSRKKYRYISSGKEWFYRVDPVVKLFSSKVKKALENSKEVRELREQEAKIAGLKQKKLRQEKSNKRSYYVSESQLNSAIKKSKSLLTVAFKQLENLKREVLKSPEMSRIEPLVFSSKEAIKSKVAGINSLKKQLLKLSKTRRTVETKVAQKTKRLSKIDDELRQLNANVSSLTQKKGDFYLSSVKNVRNTFNSYAIDVLWAQDVLKTLKQEGLAIRSNIDGRFRFEKVTDKKPFLFAMATYRSKVFYWFERLDLEITSIADLGPHNRIDDVDFKTFKARLLGLSLDPT